MVAQTYFLVEDQHFSFEEQAAFLSVFGLNIAAVINPFCSTFLHPVVLAYNTVLQ